MIIHFSVRNFGPIKETQTLSFEAEKSDYLSDFYIVEPIRGLRLLKLALIFGSNASGKTTLLRALTFLNRMVKRPLEKKDELFEFTPFSFDPEIKKQSSSFSLEFVVAQVRYLYEVEFNRYCVIREELYNFEPKKALVYERTTDVQSQTAIIKFGNKTKMTKEAVAALTANTLWNNTVLGGFSKTNIESEELKRVYSWFTDVLHFMISPGTDLYSFTSSRIENKKACRENVILLLKKADLMIEDVVIEEKVRALDDDMIDFLMTKMNLDDPEIRKIKESKKITQKSISFQHAVHYKNKIEQFLLPISEESMGTRRFYELSGILDLLIRSKHIFPVDEIESSLHPDLLEFFLLTFLANAKESQLIVTTHYREILMRKDMFRGDAIWFTEKKEDGSTDLFSLSDFDSSVVRNTSSVYNAYKSGKLGAVPFIGDYYIDLEYGETEQD